MRCAGLIETGMTQPVFLIMRSTNKGREVGAVAALRRYGRPDEIVRGDLRFLAVMMPAR